MGTPGGCPLWVMASISYDLDWQAWFWGGKLFSSTTRDGGKEEQPPENFSSPSWNIGVQTQSKLANDFLTKKNTKESWKYDLASPSPQERNRGWPWSELSFRMEWGGEHLCWQDILDQAGVGGSHPPILNGAVVFHRDSWKSDLRSADVSVIFIINYGRHAIKEKWCNNCKISTGMRVTKSVCWFHICHYLAKWLWANHLTLKTKFPQP